MSSLAKKIVKEAKVKVRKLKPSNKLYSKNLDDEKFMSTKNSDRDESFFTWLFICKIE